MSIELACFVNDLQGNMEVIGEFLENPIRVMKRYKLKKAEQEIILSRDINQLNLLAISHSKALGMLSGAHSQQCTCHHDPNC